MLYPIFPILVGGGSVLSGVVDFFSLIFFKLRVMGTVEWEAVLTSDHVGVRAETEQWVLPPLLGPSLEKMMAFSWAGLGAELGSCGTYLRSLSSGRGFCDPALVPGSVWRVGSPAWG